MADVKVVAVGRMLIRILSSLRHYICHLLFFYFLFTKRMKSPEGYGELFIEFKLCIWIHKVFKG